MTEKIYLWTAGPKTWWSTSDTSSVDWAECIEERAVSVPDGIKVGSDHTGSKRFYEIGGDGYPLQIGIAKDGTPYLFGGADYFRRVYLERESV